MGTDYLSMARREPDDAEHHGVKGMKWGVRKDRGHLGEKATTKKIAKLDKKFEKEVARANAGRVTLEFHNSVVTRMNERTKALNDSPQFRNYDERTASPKEKEAYAKAAREMIVSSFEDSVRDIYGSNASGNKKGVYNAKTDSIDLIDMDVKHADTQTVPDVSIRLQRDEAGKVISVEVVPLEVEHSDLMHHGVKGMKWGIRKKTSATDSSSTTTVAKSGNSSMTVAKHPSNESHGERYDRLRAQIKKDGPNALSTDDLNFVNARSDALKRIQNMDGAKKNWLADTGKQVMRETSKKLMKDLVQAGVNEFIVKPLVKK